MAKADGDGAENKHSSCKATADSVMAWIGCYQRVEVSASVRQSSRAHPQGRGQPGRHATFTALLRSYGLETFLTADNGVLGARPYVPRSLG